MRRRGDPFKQVLSSGAALRDPFGSHHPNTNRFAAGAQDVHAPLKQGIEVQLGSSIGLARAVQLPCPLRAVNRSGASLTSRARIRPLRQLSLHALAVCTYGTQRNVKYGMVRRSPEMAGCSFAGASEKNLSADRKLHVPVSFGSSSAVRGRPRVSRSGGGPTRIAKVRNAHEAACRRPQANVSSGPGAPESITNEAASMGGLLVCAVRQTVNTEPS